MKRIKKIVSIVYSCAILSALVGLFLEISEYRIGMYFLFGSFLFLGLSLIVTVISFGFNFYE